MQCPHCQSSNPDDASFCGECGHHLTTDFESGPERTAVVEAPHVPPLPPPPPQVNPAAPPPPPAPLESIAPYLQKSNSSGTGPQAVLPDEANGWTFAGCVPFGLFGFMNNLAGWGLLGCISGILLLLYPIYFLVIGISGRQMAWKNQSFSSVEEYRTTMANWNTAGLVFFVIGVVYVLAVSFIPSISAPTNLLNIIQ